MDSISAIHVSKIFDTKKVLEDVSLTIHQGDRIAIVGENGVGKSTLMKILCGLEMVDSGNIICDEWVGRQYSAQEPVFEPSKSILDILAELERPDECLKLMKKLGFRAESESVLDLNVCSLSGGQQKILDIASRISSAPPFLFIDEPENHLDIIARNDLIKILKKYWGAVVFVSHDRYLINEVATKIIEIEDGKTRVVSGTYEKYTQQRQQEIEAEARRWEAEKKDLGKLEKAVRILQLRARFNTKGSGIYQSRKRELERRKGAHGQKPSTERQKIKLQSIEVDKKNGKQIITCEDVWFSYSSSAQPLLKKVNLNLRFGERVAIVGRNGTGKSTFLQLLKGIHQANKGICRLGVNINIQYFDQMSSLDLSATALKIVEDALSCHEGIARSFLARLLFEQHEVTIPLSKLSGGQKNRIRIALLFAKNPEFIILDEPTNNLDPTTWEILIEHLQDYEGTMLIISHDRSFLENIDLDKFWVFRNQTVTEELLRLSEILSSM